MFTWALSFCYHTYTFVSLSLPSESSLGLYLTSDILLHVQYILGKNINLLPLHPILQSIDFYLDMLKGLVLLDL